MTDILFKTDDYVFSYRVAGICVQNGKVLLQKPERRDSFAFPGGHVELGETNADTLAREFKEEINADVTVGDLRWVAEIFFPWSDRVNGAIKYRQCHQICLYYDVTIDSKNVPTDGAFKAHEFLEGRSSDIMFHWVALDQIKNIKLYPTNAAKLLLCPDKEIKHFIYREQ